jgi:hypothetical protein
MYNSVKKEGVEAVKAEVADGKKKTLLETFDIKFTVPGETERVSVDVRLKFDGRKPTVLLVKKNEAKVVVFDVLSLHRYSTIVKPTMIVLSFPFGLGQNNLPTLCMHITPLSMEGLSIPLASFCMLPRLFFY